MTVFQKRVAPLTWFAFLAVFIVMSRAAWRDPHGPGALIALPPIIITVVGFLAMKKVIFDLADEVWDAGSSLLIKKGGREVRVELAEIVNISDSRFGNQPVTLSLRHPGALGSKILFLPPVQFIPFGGNPVIDDLIRRVDAARTRAVR